ncbi:MAG: helix-hairpin-helix domain-containing protein [Polaromonas sp.]|uniref:helix-hairpin-helix domain-containing protein n=1 Tax=Polaromonas sp. TaxID=1869339 RepID=UPI003265F871
MFKKVLAFFAAMSLVAAFAAVDVNKASEAELDGIKHIGPVTSKLIISERKKSEFKNWDDFITRVKGVGDKRAAEFSAAGLTVGGASYTGPSAKDAKAKAKGDVKADAKASKTSDKPITQQAKDAAIATKDAVKGAAIATKDAVKETAKDAKNAVMSNKDTKKEVKTEIKVETSKPAASAAKK